MASRLSTGRYSLEKKLNISDPCLKSFPTEWSQTICNLNMQNTSCLYAPPDLRKNWKLEKQSIPKLWPVVFFSQELLDNEIKKLLLLKLARQLSRGYPSETIQNHRQKLIREVAKWIGFSNNDFFQQERHYEDERHELINLFATVSKENLKEMPTDNSEWVKLLHGWLKANIIYFSPSKGVNTCNVENALIMNRQIYKVLAVDGFKGFKPHHLKFYLLEICSKSTLRKEYKSHVNGIKCMYDAFEENENLSSLTGTHSACIIFLALLRSWWCGEGMNEMADDRMIIRIDRVKSKTEGYLQQHTEYYRDLKNVDEKVLDALGKIYAEKFKDEEHVKIVGWEMLNHLGKE